MNVPGAKPTTSKVVTPKTFLASYVLSFFRVSTAMGTVELTGLEMIFSKACTQIHGGMIYEAFICMPCIILLHSGPQQFNEVCLPKAGAAKAGHDLTSGQCFEQAVMSP